MSPKGGSTFSNILKRLNKIIRISKTGIFIYRLGSGHTLYII